MKGIFGQKGRRPAGKGSQQEVLPSRHAMAELVGGDQMQRSMNNYAKKTPTGMGAMMNDMTPDPFSARPGRRRFV